MKKLVINNDDLSKLAKCVEIIKEKLDNELNLLKDEKSDIFQRFMAFNELKSFLILFPTMQKIISCCITSGHYLQHEIFHTPIAKENGWHQCILEEHDFFKKENIEDISQEVGFLIKKILESRNIS